jgi:hypothetical protein
MRGLRPFRARYPGRCPACGGPIEVGSLVITTKPRGYRHSLCLLAGEATPEVGVSAKDMAIFASLRASAPRRDRELVKRIQAQEFAPGP